MSSGPSSSPPNYFGDNPYAASPPPVGVGMPGGIGESSGRRGMVNHVQIVSVLNAVQGGMELLLAGLFFLYFVLFLVMKDEFAQGGNSEVDPETIRMVVVSVMLVFGLLLLSSAGLRFWAAFSNFGFKNRTVGIVSLCIGLFSSLTIYCAPFSIGVAVYGLIVLLNKEVKEAFEMRANGVSRDDILRVFNNRPA